MNTWIASETVRINTLALQKRKNGEHVYNFAAGDPVLKTHRHILSAAICETEKGMCPYPPVEGLSELRCLASTWLNNCYSTQYSKENVLVTCGGKFALFAALQTLVKNQDEVLVVSPYWVSYPGMVQIADGLLKILPTKIENGWKLTLDELRNNVTEKSKVLILNNACNPTGVLYTRQEIDLILQEAKTRGLFVISDEVYSGLVFDGSEYVSCGSFPEFQENILVIQSCSKNFGMTGWRVGFGFGPEKLIKQMAILQGQSTTGTSIISQWAAVGALENSDEVNSYVKNTIKRRRELFVNTYNALFATPIEAPQSAIYAFVPLSSLSSEPVVSSAAFCEQMLTHANIAIVPGSALGREGYVRFAFTETEEEIYKGLHILKAYIECLKKW